MTSTSRSGSGPATDEPIRVELRVDPPGDVWCPVAAVDGEVTDVSQHLKLGGSESRDDGSDGRIDDGDGRADSGDCQADGSEGRAGYGVCHADVTVDDGARHEYLRTDVGPGCVCRIFERIDCIPELQAVEGGGLIVSLILPDRSGLRGVVEQLRDTGATVRLRRIVRQVDDEQTIEIDVGEITPKQWEAIEVAVGEGYYDEPRGADLGDLADLLGVSKSAVSQRLSAVESKLVQSLVDGS